MAKKSKGFGAPPPKQSKKSKAKPKPPPQKIIELMPLADTEFLEDKETRLISLWKEAYIPEVSVKSLAVMHQFLSDTLPHSLGLSGKEPLTWEVNYIFGSATEAEHRKQRLKQASYLDEFQFQSVSTQISMKTGIQVEVARIQDQQSFVLPLIHLAASKKDLSAYRAIADYQLWWSDYQPTFP